MGRRWGAAVPCQPILEVISSPSTETQGIHINTDVTLQDCAVRSRASTEIGERRLAAQPYWFGIYYTLLS